MTFDVSPPAAPSFVFETLGREQKSRIWLIRQMQLQALSLPPAADGHGSCALGAWRGQRRIRPLEA